MKERAERALAEFNEAYQVIFANSRHAISTEAIALGVDTTTAANYLSIDISRNLPAGLIPCSAFARELMAWLASQCGGVFVPVNGRLTDDDRRNFGKILHACSNLAHEDDPAKRLKLFKAIETQAAIAAISDEKVKA